jgi:predicted anti-sigma-YlaC factor YlaD
MSTFFFTTKCEETRERLSAAVDGDLRGWRRVRVLRHLRNCVRCRDVLSTLGRTVEGLRLLGRNTPRMASVADAVRDRIEHE